VAVGVTQPAGFSAAGITTGIKASGRPDIALIVADRTATAAAVFTRSTTAAPPVIVSREHLETSRGRVRAIIVNSGNANAATGSAGREDALRMATLVAAELGCGVEEVLVASTGVIGVPLPMERVEEGIHLAFAELSPEGGREAAEAILTTDAGTKVAGTEIPCGETTIRIGAIAKGAGMIRPDLGTMLAFVTTDADCDSATLDRLLRTAMDRSFNRITVDGTTSTSDTVVLLASGASGCRPTGACLERFAEALDDLCLELALAIVRDGEGAARIGRWAVVGASDDREATRLAFAIAEDQLVRCALHGADPNWGRIVAALGAAGGVDPDHISVTLDGIGLCRQGTAVAIDDTEGLAQAAGAGEVHYLVEIGDGPGESVVWGSDLSPTYVRLNAEYTT
jgi:glutamate N-acetyltransferase/amino-acid N-acetyltransferase